MQIFDLSVNLYGQDPRDTTWLERHNETVFKENCLYAPVSNEKKLWWYSSRFLRLETPIRKPHTILSVSTHILCVVLMRKGKPQSHSRVVSLYTPGFFLGYTQQKVPVPEKNTIFVPNIVYYDSLANIGFGPPFS